MKEHAEEICQGHHGKAFKGLRKNWANHFAERHWKELQPYWSHPLDHSWAHQGNKNTKKAFFDLLEDTINGGEDEEPILAELIYGTEESGIQEGIGTRERVYGARGKKVQHQQRSEGRENIIVIVTIWADGTSIPPAMIYKGEDYQTSWKQDNPLNTL